MKVTDSPWVRDNHKYVDLVGADGVVTHVKYSLRWFCGFLHTLDEQEVNSSVHSTRVHLPPPGTPYHRTRSRFDPPGSPDAVDDVWPDTPAVMLDSVFTILSKFDPTQTSPPAPLTLPEASNGAAFTSALEGTPFHPLSRMTPASVSDMMRLAAALHIPIIVEVAASYLGAFLSRLATHRASAPSLLASSVPLEEREVVDGSPKFVY